MKKSGAPLKAQKQIDWDTVCERTRQRCNKLTDEQRRRLQAKALQIIYNADEQAATRSR